MLFTSNKKLMLETFLIFFVSWLVKIVHVKLPHKRAKIIVFEVFGQNILCEGIGIFYNKAVAFLIPKYCILVWGVLNN